MCPMNASQQSIWASQEGAGRVVSRDLSAQELSVFLGQGSLLRRLASHFLEPHDH